MSESRTIKPVKGKPILSQSDMDDGLTEEVMLLGIDLGDRSVKAHRDFSFGKAVA